MTPSRLLLTLLLACGLLLAVRPATAAAPPDTPSAQFVQHLGTRALTSLTDRGISNAERAKRVRALLHEDFDIKTIGKFVLGTHWREATATQKSEYFKLFEDMIVQTYTQRFADYSGQSFQVTGALSSDTGGSNDAIINSVIHQNNGAPDVSVSWRVRDHGGQLKIVDVLVDDISMSVTQRSDFDAVIQKGGGNIDTLLASLRDRTGDK